MTNRNNHPNNNTGWLNQNQWNCSPTSFGTITGMEVASTSRGFRSVGCDIYGDATGENISERNGRGRDRRIRQRDDRKDTSKFKKPKPPVAKKFNPGPGEPGGPGDPLKFGLNGSLQKWYIRFLKRGFTPIIARQMAVDRKAVRARRRLRRKLAKQAALEVELNDNAAAIGNSGVHSCIKQLAILPISYPRHMIAEDELPQLQEIILDEILKGNYNFKVKFNDVYFRPGMMIVDCCTNETYNWLQTIVPKLGSVCCPAWTGHKLITCTGPAVPKTPCITMLVPNCTNKIELKKVMMLLDAQNDALNIRYWKILTHNKQGDGMVLTVAIDELSLDSIKANNLIIHYKFGSIPIHISRNSFEDVYKMCKTNQKVKMTKKEMKKKQLQDIEMSMKRKFSDSDDDDGDDNDNDNNNPSSNESNSMKI